MRTALLLSLALTLSAVAAPVPKALKAKTTDAELLQGRWEIVSQDSGQGHQEKSAYWLEVKGGLMWMGNGRGENPPFAPFTLDEEKSPRQFDVAWVGWPKPQSYIYKIEGDTLTCCHSQQNQSRPADFTGGDGRYCFLFRRVKE